MYKLGSTLKHTIRGSVGTAVGYYQDITGCDLYGVIWTEGDGAGQYDGVHVGFVELVKGREVKDMPRHPHLGKRVRDRISGFMGTVVGAEYHLHYAHHLTVRWNKVNPDGALVEHNFHEEHLVLLDENWDEVEDPKTGNPTPVKKTTKAKGPSDPRTLRVRI